MSYAILTLRDPDTGTTVIDVPVKRLEYTDRLLQELDGQTVDISYIPPERD